MEVEVFLDPAGQAAEKILAGWQNAWKLENTGYAGFKLSGENCLDIIFDLRARCYEQGITVNLSFLGA